MRTIQFTVTDSEYATLKDVATATGLGGQYAVSTLARMVTFQVAGHPLLEKRQGVFVSMTQESYARMKQYAVRKGFKGPDPVAGLMHKSTFDIMAKYPLSGKHETA